MTRSPSYPPTLDALRRMALRDMTTLDQREAELRHELDRVQSYRDDLRALVAWAREREVLLDPPARTGAPVAVRLHAEHAARVLEARRIA